MVARIEPGEHRVPSVAPRPKILGVRNDYLQRNPLSNRTLHTLTDRQEFEDQPTRIRERCFADDKEEFHEGLCCVAVQLGDGLSDFGVGLSAPCRLGGSLRQVRRDPPGDSPLPI